MRLPDGSIRNAILHNDKPVRETAVEFFAKSYSQDETVMPLVIEAIETYGRDQASGLLRDAEKLIQTSETLDWMIGELGRHGDSADYQHSLSRIFCHADPQLLKTRECQIDDAPGFAADLREAFAERLQMCSWDAERCWQELETFCEVNKEKEYVTDVDLPFANRVVEALARVGSGSRDHILAILCEEVDDYRNNPMGWMEPLVVRLAGEMRLQDAVPLVVDKLHEDADWLSQECAEALVKIGSNTAVIALCEPFLQAEWHYRLYATGALENIPSDVTVETCLHLLEMERDWDIKTSLAQALLLQFATEAIEPVRQLVIQRQDVDIEALDVRDRLVPVCKVMEERFSEFEDWERDAEERERDWQKACAERRGERMPLGLMGTENVISNGFEQPANSMPLKQEQRVGRNAPCPCGSGKKFKQCCMGRG